MKSFLVLLLATGALGLAHAAPKEEEVSHSLAPILGYNPTYRVFFGGGYFLSSERLRWSNLLLITLRDTYRFEQEVEIQMNRKWRLIPYGRIDVGFEPNYGRSSRTRVGDRSDVFGDYLEPKVVAARRFNEHLEFQAGYAYRYWRQRLIRGSQKNSIPSRTYHVFMTRTIGDFTGGEPHRQGWLSSLEADYGFTSRWYVRTALTFQYYVPLGSRIVVASKTKGGYVFGTSFFHSDFTLGGTDELRGFLKNRFRGNKLLLQQTEIRFSVYGPLKAATFVDIGETTHKGFMGPQISYGGGIRYALPPDEIQVIRVDVGNSADQFGVFFDFGQSF